MFVFFLSSLTKFNRSVKCTLKFKSLPLPLPLPLLNPLPLREPQRYPWPTRFCLIKKNENCWQTSFARIFYRAKMLNSAHKLAEYASNFFIFVHFFAKICFPNKFDLSCLNLHITFWNNIFYIFIHFTSKKICLLFFISLPYLRMDSSKRSCKVLQIKWTRTVILGPFLFFVRPYNF